MTPPRGRPRQYDPELALEAAMNTFWLRGFSATSLTDLVEATGMNRPSLYAAFGDKQAIYMKALQRYLERMRSTLGEALMCEEDLSRALTQFYFSAIDLYLGDETPQQRGCMVATTASVESNDETIREALHGTIASLDTLLAKRMRLAAQRDQVPSEDAAARGHLATAVLHSLSMRSRAGHSRRALRKFARESVALLVP